MMGEPEIHRGPDRVSPADLHDAERLMRDALSALLVDVGSVVNLIEARQFGPLLVAHVDTAVTNAASLRDVVRLVTAYLLPCEGTA